MKRPVPGRASPDETGAKRPFVFRLYIAGTTPKSTRAIINTRSFCEKHLHGRYDLEVVDICCHPELAGPAQIIAAPTLVKLLPLPLRRFVGEMTQTDHLMRSMGLACA